MADITITLLTPISIRLSWTGANGDYEVWWKSDHPAGQEFAPLATVTGISYDVGDLSWSTTYYFKVKAVGGSFGNIFEIFVCCGQGILLNPPSGPPTGIPVNTDYWQQAVDVYGDTVAFVPLDQGETAAFVILYDIPSGKWTYKAQVDPLSFVDYRPIQLIRDRFSSVSRTISVLNFGFWNGTELTQKAFSVPSDMEAGSFFLDWQDTAYNENGRVVLTGYVAKDYTIQMTNKVFNQTDPSFAVYSYNLYINTGDTGIVTVYLNGVSFGTYPFTRGQAVSVSVGPLYYGLTYTLRAFVDRSGTYPNTDPAGWTNDILIDLTLGQGHATASVKNYVSGYYNRMYSIVSYDNGTNFSDPVFLFEGYGYGYCGMSENSDGAIWIIVQNNVELVTAEITYQIYKYTVGSGVTLIKEIGTDPGTYYGDYCKIAAVGDKIVALYTYLNPGNQVTEAATFRLSVSNDNGNTWVDRTIAGYASGMDYNLCISGDNIIVYLWDTGGGFHLMLSTDDGVNWTEKWNYTGYFQDYMEYSWLRSDGDTVVWAGCNFSENGTNPLGFLLSLDAGVTWAYKECTLEDFYQVLAPA